jgi:hypothetical protein
MDVEIDLFEDEIESDIENKNENKSEWEEMSNVEMNDDGDDWLMSASIHCDKCYCYW